MLPHLLVVLTLQMLRLEVVEVVGSHPFVVAESPLSYQMPRLIIPCLLKHVEHFVNRCYVCLFLPATIPILRRIVSTYQMLRLVFPVCDYSYSESHSERITDATSVE